MGKKIFGTKEWANANYNIISGCLHDCKYCYSKEMAIRFKRKNCDTWKDEELNQNKINEKVRFRQGTIMFPSSHDITPKFFDYSKNVILNILKEKNNLLIVSKPHLDLMDELSYLLTEYKDQVLFRFTIGSIKSETLSFWEPLAPTFNERFDCLKLLYNKGYKTSVSCEPILDISTEELVNKIYPFITDSIWIGKPNYLLRRLRMNGYSERSETYLIGQRLLKDLSDNYFLELQKKFCGLKLIKWKDSVKQILGMDLLTTEGEDR